MRPKILFVVMSAVHRADVVDQLARSLAPHQVLVHHDFSQTPQFELSASNILFVPDPKRTGWADFGFVDGIFHSLHYALDHLEFDYLQLLSPTCLPIKTMEQFEAHVSNGEEAHFGSIALRDDTDALMWVGYRAFTPYPSFRHRVARWLTGRHFLGSTGRRDEAGIWLKSGFATTEKGRMSMLARLARLSFSAMSHSLLGRHIFGKDLPPYVGSVWFGARRHVVQALVAAFAQPGLRDYFSRLRIAEEFLIPTLLKRTGARAGPLNHYINRFDEAHPQWIDDSDFATLRTSNKFFARKFSNDPQSSIRLRVIDELVACPLDTAAGSRSRSQPASSTESASLLPEPPRHAAPARDPATHLPVAAQATPGGNGGHFALRGANPNMGNL